MLVLYGLFSWSQRYCSSRKILYLLHTTILWALSIVQMHFFDPGILHNTIMSKYWIMLHNVCYLVLEPKGRSAVFESSVGPSSVNLSDNSKNSAHKGQLYVTLIQSSLC